MKLVLLMCSICSYVVTVCLSLSLQAVEETTLPHHPFPPVVEFPLMVSKRRLSSLSCFILSPPSSPSPPPYVLFASLSYRFLIFSSALLSFERNIRRDVKEI